MAYNLSPQAILFVSRDKLIYYSAELNEVLELSLTSDVVRDLEIVNPSALERILRMWLDQLRIIPGQVILLLDDSVCFHQPLSQFPINEEDPQVQDFLEIVPFNEVMVKHFPMQKGAHMTVLNENFIMPLMHVLEKLNFVVVGISPAFILGIDFNKNFFNKEIAQQVMSVSNALLDYNFLSPDEVEAKLVAPQPFLSVQIDTKLIVMISIFVVLLIVLAVLLIGQNGIQLSLLGS